MFWRGVVGFLCFQFLGIPKSRFSFQNSEEPSFIRECAPSHMYMASLLCALTALTPAWSEVRVASLSGSSTSLELGQDLARGNCVLQVSDVASPEECAELLKYGLRAADKQQASTWARTASFLAEFTSNNPRSEGRVRVPIRSLHPRQAQQFDHLMARVCSIVDNELPSVAKLFERDVDMDGDVTSSNMKMCDEPSTFLSALHASGGLTYSTREPAINVYRSKGEFLAHTDRQTLTVLIPLSSPESYEGGGTGFWSPASDEGLPQYGQPSSAPGVVLRPPQGTALLYGGRITHAGMPVETGCRVIFLASFSARRLDLEVLDTV